MSTAKRFWLMVLAACLPVIAYASVERVYLVMPAEFNVTGSPIIGDDTFGVTWATGQVSNRVLASPDGTAGAVSLRQLTVNDLPAMPVTVGSPNVRTLSLATAYQATDNTKAAYVTVNVASTAALTLGGGQTNTAELVMGPTTGVASGTGSALGRYNNGQTGTVVVGIALNSALTGQVTVMLPAGWYFAVRQTSGTVSIASAFDQSLG